DIVLVDLTHPAMRPVRDPLRSLVYSAADRAVKEVYVDGQQLVRDGKVLTVDRDAAADTLQKVQADMLQAVSSRDRLGRSAEQVSPLSLARG
ncbi:MAG: N-ethylammeline chlorohydrolase, partial [Alphaproteobacteria bacterium]|nr:N-ethylammeline chlorohydrolase [Alphaproteobacteria bacterium]